MRSCPKNSSFHNSSIKKIKFRPITVRQFLILLVTTFCIFIFYVWRSYFVGSALLLAIFSGTFAFMKINGQPFHVFS